MCSLFLCSFFLSSVSYYLFSCRCVSYPLMCIFKFLLLLFISALLYCWSIIWPHLLLYFILFYFCVMKILLQYYIERQCLLKCTRQILMHACKSNPVFSISLVLSYIWIVLFIFAFVFGNASVITYTHTHTFVCACDVG